MPIGVVIGPFQRDPVRANRGERLLGQRRARLLHHVDARVPDVPVERDAGRLEHAARRLGELGAGAVAGDQGDLVRHAQEPTHGVPGGLPGTGMAVRGCLCTVRAVSAASDFKPGLEGVVAFETEIAEPDKEGGALRYRGVDIEDLVGHYPFEKVWGLLVDERLEPGLPHAERIELQDPSGSVPADLQAGPRDARAEVGARQARRHHAGAGARRPGAAVGRGALARRAGGAREAGSGAGVGGRARARTPRRSS